MFCPPGLESRYVPLRKISWHWGGAVTSADSWTTITSPVATVDATGAECSEHPKWSANSNLELEIVDTPPSP